jgi:hypothetical protein
MIDKLTVVGIKSEAAQNTAAALGATDYVKCAEPKVKVVPEFLPRELSSQSLDSIAAVLGNLFVDVTLKLPLKGSGTPGTAWGPLSALLQAGAMSEVIAASNSVTGVAITNGGSGYTSAPTVTFTGGSGSGAAGFAVLNGGVVVGVIITNPGSGYISDPTVGFTGGGGSGAAATASRSGSILYAPLSAPASGNFFTFGKSCTIEYFKGAFTNAMKHVVKGCVATSLKITAAAGKFVMLEVSLRGLYQAPVSANMPATTYNATIEPIFQVSGFNSHLYKPVIEKFEIDFGLKAAKRDDSDAAYGIGGFQVVDRAPKGSFNPEMVIPATHDFYARMIAGSEGSQSYVLGSTAGNIITIGLPKTQYTDLDYVSRDGILALEGKMQFNQNTGDDFITIVMS